MDYVIGVLVRWEWAAVARSQVFEQFDAGAGRAPQSGDTQVGAEDVVEVLLLGAEVLALSSDVESEQVTIEMQCLLHIAHGE